MITSQDNPNPTSPTNPNNGPAGQWGGTNNNYGSSDDYWGNTKRNVPNPRFWAHLVGSGWNWLGGNQGTANLQENRAAMAPYLDAGSPYINPQSGYQGNYNQLITMLGNRAAGQGPSVAGDAYKQAASEGIQRALALSNSGQAGGGRAALQQIGNTNQGLASGYAMARNNEMAGATGQLGGAINLADASQLNRDKANQEAWLKMLNEQFQNDRTLATSTKSNGESLGAIAKAAAAF